MNKIYRMLIINPGSTSTKIAIFENEKNIFETSVFHDAPLLMSYPTVNDQIPYRKKVILDYLKQQNIDLSTIDCFVGRGGNSYSVESGTYQITDLLVEDTLAAKGGTDHPSNLGVVLAKQFADEFGGQAFTVDPICVDELSDYARVTGVSGIYRQARFHVLNAKATARKYSESINKKYEDLNLIVCHIDGGITVCAHEKGKMVDGNDGAGGDGPFTPTRTGSISVTQLLDYIKDKDIKEVKKICTRNGGFMSHFNTSDSDTIHKMMEDGDKKADLIWHAMVYNICKQIGAMSAVLKGKVDAIILTGGLCRFADLVNQIEESCGWISKIVVYHQEFEHEALALGALRVLTGEEKAKIYSGKPVFTGFNFE